jgi:hypothetical protein
VHAQILLGASELASPHRIENLLVGERASRGAEQRREDLPLDGGEVQLCPSRETFRLIVSMVSPPMFTGPGVLVAAASVFARRICAFARAASSSTLNGFVT